MSCADGTNTVLEIANSLSRPVIALLPAIEFAVEPHLGVTLAADQV